MHPYESYLDSPVYGASLKKLLFFCLLANFFDMIVTSNLQSTYLYVQIPGKFTQELVSDLRSETKGSRFESGCYLCAEASTLQ